jgi:uncharacterized protein YdeI (YjbR/CyaY-like superfamily)
MPDAPTFFATPSAFRHWLQAHHATATELLVGFYKKGSGKPSITWPESVDEALSFGWIDGVRKSLSEEAYCIRFTPRKKTSNWSLINVARVAELEKLGRMSEAGRRAFAARTPGRTGVYSFEREPSSLSPAGERRLRENQAAAAFFDAQPPWYRRTTTHWVTSAKREPTRERRLDQLIADSAAGRCVGAFARPPAAQAGKAPPAKQNVHPETEARREQKAKPSKKARSTKKAAKRAPPKKRPVQKM